MGDREAARRPTRSIRGFTLLEVLVSLAILSGTLLLAFRIMSGAIFAEERSERWTSASFLGESLVREATAVFPDTGETEGKFSPPMDAYSWKRTVKPAIHPDAREVHVTVTWTSGRDSERVTLSGIAVK